MHFSLIRNENIVPQTETSLLLSLKQTNKKPNKQTNLRKEIADQF